MFQCWPSPWSMCSLMVLPSARWKVSYLFRTAWTVYSPAGTSFRLRIGIAPGGGVNNHGLAGLPAVDREAEDDLRTGRVVDLVARLVARVGREDQQQAAIEGLRADFFGEGDGERLRDGGEGKSRTRAKTRRFMLASLQRGLGFVVSHPSAKRLRMDGAPGGTPKVQTLDLGR